MTHEDTVDPPSGDASPVRPNTFTPSSGQPSNLAALLDRFSASVADPATSTVGSFAETVQALHAELQLLAHHFGAVAERTADVLDTPAHGETGPVELDVDLPTFDFEATGAFQPVR